MAIRIHTLVLLALVQVGCATTGVLPRAQFAGMTITTVQPEPGSDALSLDLGLDFRVHNPWGIKLTVPAHEFGLELGGVSLARSGTKGDTKVPPRKSEILHYQFRFNLKDPKLEKVRGTEARFAFTAKADVDLPRRVLEGLQENLPDLEGLGELGALAEGAIQVAGEGKGKAGRVRLQMDHEGAIKLPKLPVLEPAGDASPKVALVGDMQWKSLQDLLGPLTESVEPFRRLVEGALRQDLNTQVELPVGQLLEAMGVPRGQLGGALQALNTFLAVQGQGRIASTNVQIPLPVSLPSALQLVSSIDPEAGQKARRFVESWRTFLQDGIGELGNELRIPVKLPEGLRVESAFRVENPNQFPIHAPSFRLAVVARDGTPVAQIQAVPRARLDLPLGRVADRDVTVEGGGSREMVLAGDFNWAALGATLVQLAAGQADTSGLQLRGEMVLDLGYGPITLPVSVVMP